MFIERAMVARSLGVPRNKEVGAMVHGLLGDGVFYYSGGVFNGDGPSFRNFDNQPDAIGRVTLSPFAGGEGMFRRLIGGRIRLVRAPRPGADVSGAGDARRPALSRAAVDDRASRRACSSCASTAPSARSAASSTIPFGTRFGLRGEAVYKRQELAETDAAPGERPVTPLGTATLDGIAAYGELWLWVAGDERMLPVPGLQLPRRARPALPPRLRGRPDGGGTRRDS